MDNQTGLRTYAHALVDRMSPERIRALLDLLDEDFFGPEEVAEIKALGESDDWRNWREVRDDL